MMVLMKRRNWVVIKRYQTQVLCHYQQLSLITRLKYFCANGVKMQTCCLVFIPWMVLCWFGMWIGWMNTSLVCFVKFRYYYYVGWRATSSSIWILFYNNCLCNFMCSNTHFLNSRCPLFPEFL